MPCELRHWMWLPEIEQYTERTSQPAISSASSTARWIDCTVESMSTTTPRLLGDAGRPLARADLRYTNGFAIAWGEPPAEGQA